MVPKTGTRLPKSRIPLSDAQFADLIGTALQFDLGGSRRAAKAIMGWTGVSDHTARDWLHGRKSPSSLHLLGLASHSRSVMTLILRLTGHDRVDVGIDLDAMETGLEKALATIRMLRAKGNPDEKT